MKTAFTPGGWRQETVDGITGIISDDGVVIGRINAPGNNKTRQMANAALIADAPAMYEALQGMVNIITHPKATRAECIIIAKDALLILSAARGEK